MKGNEMSYLGVKINKTTIADNRGRKTTFLHWKINYITQLFKWSGRQKVLDIKFNRSRGFVKQYIKC